MTRVPPPPHLSEQAQQHLRTPPHPIPNLNFVDSAVATGFRSETHAVWEAEPKGRPGSWIQRDETIGGVSCVRFATAGADLDSDRLLVHLHGGAYVVGSPKTNAALPIAITLRTAIPVVSIDYRLAPEHPCPAAVEDAVAVLTALGESHELAGIFGESAGGGLAVSTLVELTARNLPTPATCALLSPWVDLTLSGDSHATMIGTDPEFVNVEVPPTLARAYAGDNTSDPVASPLFADLTGLPPTLIQVGGREILLSDSIRLAAAMRVADAAGPVVLDVWDGLWHVWQLDQDLPETTVALDEVARFLTLDSKAART
ncbi:MAG: alpha/beta hydrolase [Actinomycetota bacterium]|nr:alpha/beta hydrolase [Actinomycetota bacterium]